MPRVILISGYRGLAKTLIQSFSAAGHQVSALVRRGDLIPELQREFPNTHFVAGEVNDRETARRWVESAMLTFGRIDALINNAAITGPVGKFHELNFDEVAHCLDVNLMAPAFLCQLLIPHFQKHSGGVIINLSGGGATFPRPSFATYGVSKCAIVRLTETLAAEYPGLRFFAVSPGTLKTPMVESFMNLDPARVGSEYTDMQKKMATGGDDPQKAADLAMWLVENQPEWLNGKLISAIWDNYKQPVDKPGNTGWWTLRRVDEVVEKNLRPASP